MCLVRCGVLVDSSPLLCQLGFPVVGMLFLFFGCLAVVF